MRVKMPVPGPIPGRDRTCNGRCLNNLIQQLCHFFSVERIVFGVEVPFLPGAIRVVVCVDCTFDSHVKEESRS